MKTQNKTRNGHNTSRHERERTQIQKQINQRTNIYIKNKTDYEGMKKPRIFEHVEVWRVARIPDPFLKIPGQYTGMNKDAGDFRGIPNKNYVVFKMKP